MIPLRELRARRVFASDGAAGVLNDVFFDTAKWQVRYLAVDSGLRMANERLLVPAASARFAADAISVDLNRRQFGPGPGARSLARLFSGRETYRYRVEATDGPAGELDDLLLETDWSVAGLALAATDWLLPGARVALDPRRVESIDRARRSVRVRLTGDEIRSLPRMR